MTPEKPIHVQVAEALGQLVQYREHQQADGAPWGYWCGEDDGVGGHEEIPRYDRDWKAAGPLIERFKVELSYNPNYGWFGTTYDDELEPNCHHIGESAEFAPCGCAQPTALLALCHTILVSKI